MNAYVGLRLFVDFHMQVIDYFIQYLKEIRSSQVRDFWNDATFLILSHIYAIMNNQCYYRDNHDTVIECMYCLKRKRGTDVRKYVMRRIIESMNPIFLEKRYAVPLFESSISPTVSKKSE